MLTENIPSGKGLCAVRGMVQENTNSRSEVSSQGNWASGTNSDTGSGPSHWQKVKHAEVRVLSNVQQNCTCLTAFNVRVLQSSCTTLRH